MLLFPVKYHKCLPFESSEQAEQLRQKNQETAEVQSAIGLILAKLSEIFKNLSNLKLFYTITHLLGES